MSIEFVETDVLVYAHAGRSSAAGSYTGRRLPICLGGALDDLSGGQLHGSV